MINPFPNNDPSDNKPDSTALDIFYNNPFWIWETKEHNRAFSQTMGKCCFNHIIGLPVKNDKQYPIFLFQKLIYDAIEDNNNIWILKSRGIGITTFMIRYLAYKILSSSELEHKSIFIISGTREEHAAYIKQKLQDLFLTNFPNIKLQSKYTELWLKNTWIKIFPTKNIRDIRGYFEASYIWLDESDFMDLSIQEELIPAISPYQEKSNCTIILSSTPNRPDGLMQQIEKDANSNYKKLKLDYTYGLGTIYDPKDIEKKKKEVDFSREYECQYIGREGNIFTQYHIAQCTALGEEYAKIPVSLYTLKSCAIDFGFSSSATGIVLLEHIRGEKGEHILRVIDTELIEKGDPNYIVNIAWAIWSKFNYMNVLFFVDGSNRALVNMLKIRFSEPLVWDANKEFGDMIRIRPVNFSTEHKPMLSNLHAVITKGYLAIEPKYDQLLISLRTAYAKELHLDKEETTYDDLLDALRMALKAYSIK
jgi:Terminase large subunit, T4likevirus-type, N-terminal